MPTDTKTVIGPLYMQGITVVKRVDYPGMQATSDFEISFHGPDDVRADLSELRDSFSPVQICTYDPDASEVEETEAGKNVRAMPKRVICNPPATIVFWDDGVKTVAKTSEGTMYDPFVGVAVCVAKRKLSDGLEDGASPNGLIKRLIEEDGFGVDKFTCLAKVNPLLEKLWKDVVDIKREISSKSMYRGSDVSSIIDSIQYMIWHLMWFGDYQHELIDSAVKRITDEADE